MPDVTMKKNKFFLMQTLPKIIDSDDEDNDKIHVLLISRWKKMLFFFTINGWKTRISVVFLENTQKKFFFHFGFNFWVWLLLWTRLPSPCVTNSQKNVGIEATIYASMLLRKEKIQYSEGCVDISSSFILHFPSSKKSLNSVLFDIFKEKKKVLSSFLFWF